MDWKRLITQAAPTRVTVNVELPYERTVAVEISTLSYAEWLGVETECPEPVIPRTLAGPNGTKLPNREDLKYRQDLAAVQEERAYRRLALALEKGGTAVPGATAADKAAAIKAELDAGVANALMVFLANAAMGGRATAEAAADTFRE